MAEGKKEVAGAGIVDGIAAVVETAVRAGLGHLPASLENQVVDSVIDKLEALVNGTSTPLDDAVVEPVIERLRASFNIPDGDA
jgi:hypothetical protein